MRPNESGIATDVMLFSQQGARLVHQCCVFGDNVTHPSLRGSFMLKLAKFTHQACADVAGTASSPVRPAPMPLGPAHQTPDHAPPARNAARAATTVMSPMTPRLVFLL